MNRLFIILFSFVFVLGQVLRVQLGSGVVLLGLDVIVGVFSLVWLVRTLARQTKPRSFVFLPLILFIITAILSLIVNLTWLSLQEVSISSLYLVRFVAYAGMYFFIRELTKSEIALLKKAVIGIIAALVAIGLFQFMYYPNLRNLYYLGWDEHLYRLFSTFFDPNFAGAMFVLFFLFLSMYMKRIMTHDWYQRIPLSVLYFSIILSIFLTYSRTGLAMLIGSGVAYLFLLKKKVFVLLFVIFVSILFLLTIDTSLEGQNPFRIASTQARIDSYTTAIDVFSKHPIMGVGFNAYRYAQNEYGYRIGENWQISHAGAGTDNSFLFVLATTGVIGFIAFVFLMLRILSFTTSQMKKGSEIARVTLVSFLALFVGSFFINALFYPFIMAWMWMLVAFTDTDKH